MSDISGLAAEALKHFEHVSRDADRPRETEYTRLRDSAPQWLRDLVFDAHGAGEMMPDDHRYVLIESALDCIAEADDAEDAGHEWADGMVDTYNSERIEWLGSHSARLAYCDEYRADYLAPGDDPHLIDMIGGGQYVEAREVYGSVVAFLEHAAECPGCEGSGVRCCELGADHA